MELWVDGRFVPLPANINTVQVGSVAPHCCVPLSALSPKNCTSITRTYDNFTAEPQPMIVAELWSSPLK
jgi:hypothetical protein